MSFLKQITKTSLLIPFEKIYIQSHSYHKELIPEQNTSEKNTMYQLIFMFVRLLELLKIRCK